MKKAEKIYFGVTYWCSDLGFWFCELAVSETFKTQKEVKYYIKDWHENEGKNIKLPSEF